MATGGGGAFLTESFLVVTGGGISGGLFSESAVSETVVLVGLGGGGLRVGVSLFVCLSPASLTRMLDRNMSEGGDVGL